MISSWSTVDSWEIGQHINNNMLNLQCMLYSIHLFKKDLRRKLNKFASRNNKACLKMNYSVMLSKQQFHFKMFADIWNAFFSVVLAIVWAFILVTLRVTCSLDTLFTFPVQFRLTFTDSLPPPFQQFTYRWWKSSLDLCQKTISNIILLVTCLMAECQPATRQLLVNSQSLVGRQILWGAFFTITTNYFAPILACFIVSMWLFSILFLS